MKRVFPEDLIKSSVFNFWFRLSQLQRDTQTLGYDATVTTPALKQNIFNRSTVEEKSIVVLSFCCFKNSRWR